MIKKIKYIFGWLLFKYRKHIHCNHPMDLQLADIGEDYIMAVCTGCDSRIL